MKLHGSDVVTLDDGAEFLPMLAHAHGAAEARSTVSKTMVEVEIGSEAGTEISPGVLEANSVPAHVRHSYTGRAGKTLHLPADPAETRNIGRFIAAIGEQLHTHTNT